MATALWFIIHQHEAVLLTVDNQLPQERDISALSANFTRQFSLGEHEGSLYYCAALDPSFEIPASFKIVPLKQTLALLHPDYYRIAVKAYSVLHWDNNHQACGRCGQATIYQPPGFERVCSACQLSFFPRISPSIIVLIHDGDRLVMARGPHFPPSAYGLVAGFVEAGESLEEAAHREVFEEVGLRVKNLRYFASQPWPFPDSLMVGFFAEYASGDIVIDKTEIEAAGWYRYDQLPGRPSTSISIASKLLDHFVATRRDHAI